MKYYFRDKEKEINCKYCNNILYDGDVVDNDDEIIRDKDKTKANGMFIVASGYINREVFRCNACNKLTKHVHSYEIDEDTDIRDYLEDK